MCLDISHGIGQQLPYEPFGISASAPRGIRTPDLFVRSEALYPLSYEGIGTVFYSLCDGDITLQKAYR